MRRWLTIVVLAAVFALSGAAGAQDIRINPVPPGVQPQWAHIPGVPQVSWAPNLPTDVFRYRNKYYFFWGGYFYRGPAPQGPWKAVAKVPQVFSQIDPTYFKTAGKAGGPSPPGEPAPEPSGPKVIDIPPAAPAPAEPAPAPVSPPGPEEPPAPPPRVM